jgi:hypothetical protein
MTRLASVTTQDSDDARVGRALREILGKHKSETVAVLKVHDFVTGGTEFCVGVASDVSDGGKARSAPTLVEALTLAAKEGTNERP